MDREENTAPQKPWYQKAWILPVLGGLVGFFALGAVVQYVAQSKKSTSGEGQGQEARLKHYETIGSAPHLKSDSQDKDDLSWWELIRLAAQNLQIKVERMEKALSENQRLKQENAALKIEVESLRFERLSEDSKKKTKAHSAVAKKHAGSPVAKTLETIRYRPPKNLYKDHLYVLGVKYFKTKEYEKAAVIFTELLELQEDPSYRTAHNFVMAGVAWYGVHNWNLAQNYFERALKLPADSQSLKAQAQSRLWLAMVAHQRGDTKLTSYWLHDLVDHHPRSPEAQMINKTRNKKGARDVASE